MAAYAATKLAGASGLVSITEKSFDNLLYFYNVCIFTVEEETQNDHENQIGSTGSSFSGNLDYHKKRQRQKRAPKNTAKITVADKGLLVNLSPQRQQTCRCCFEYEFERREPREWFLLFQFGEEDGAAVDLMNTKKVNTEATNE